MYFLSFLPLIDPGVLWIITGAAAFGAFAATVVFGRAVLLRLPMLAVVVLALWNPNLSEEERSPVKSVAVVVVDRTTSQKLGDRETVTDAVSGELKQRLEQFPDMEIRYVDVTDAPDNSGTRLFAAMDSVLGDIPAQRLAGIVVISDGVVHDVPHQVSAMEIPAPMHVLVTGYETEKDRQVRLLTAPRFGIVGKKLRVSAVVEERSGTGTADIAVRIDGRLMTRRRVNTGTPFSMEITVAHAGMNIVDIEAAPMDDELTLANNRAVLSIEGVRDKLRVLLVSGEPHAGGRTWRDLLKADPNIELVHFTILRDTNKAEYAPARELALIPFPVNELFIEKISQFDLIILDRFDNYGLLPFEYFVNIQRYVQEGGALLVAAGPEFADNGSLALTPIQSVIPAFPDGEIYEQPYKPGISPEGRRHPVTRNLPGSERTPPTWGEWLRQIGAQKTQGVTLLSGYRDLPLLILNRVNQGRSALILSDHPWLWARGYRGGGPHADLLRRIAHWLMKEPALEEEALRASIQNATLTIERQSMGDAVGDVTVTAPDGTGTVVRLSAKQPGLFEASVAVSLQGIYTLASDGLTAFASFGPGHNKELEDVFSNTELLQAPARHTGGVVLRVGVSPGVAPVVPKLRSVGPNTRAFGNGWIGLRASGESVIHGMQVFPLGLGFAALLLFMAATVTTWLVESRRRSNPSA